MTSTNSTHHISGTNEKGKPVSPEDRIATPTSPARPTAAARRARLRVFSGIGALILAIALLVIARAASAQAAPLPQFGEAGSEAGQFEAPAGIAVNQGSGDVYIADRNNNRIEEFDGEGHFLLAWGWGVVNGKAELQTCVTSCLAGLEGSGAGQFEVNSAEGVAVDNSLGLSHDLYVIDGGNNRVEKFGPDGEFLLMFGGHVNKAGGDICLAGEECQAGEPGTGVGAFERLNGRSIVVDAAGDVYVGDENRIQRFSPSGVVEPTAQISLPGAGDVVNLAVDPAGDFFVQTSGLVGVHVYDTAGTELGKPRDELGIPNRIAAGPAGELFVNDESSGHHIFEYDAAGARVSSFDAGQENANSMVYAENLNVLYVAGRNSVRAVVLPLPGPLVFGESSEVTGPVSATLSATVNPEGAATEYHFDYGTTTGYGESTPVSAPLDRVNQVQSVTVVATGGTFTLAFKGEASVEVPFNATAAEVEAALAGIPGLGAGQVAVTGEPGGPWSVEFTGALAGEPVPELTAEPANLTGPEPSATVAITTAAVSLFEDRPVNAAIAGLLPDTVYHFRTVAVSQCEKEPVAHPGVTTECVTDGPDQTFTTLPAVAIDGEFTTEVSSTSATLGAELNPQGEATEYHFQFGPTTSYGQEAPEPEGSAGSGHGDVSVALQLQGLTPNTTYHYRVVAHNALGTVAGEDRTFTTEGPEASSVLADGRQWEMVSPPNKDGVSLEALTEGGGVIQAAEDGSAMTYIAKAAIEAGSPSNRSIENTQVLSKRGPNGWESKDISTPHEAVATIEAGDPSEYKAFSGDLSTGIVEPEGATPLSAGTSERTPYLREANGKYVPLVAGCPPPGKTCPRAIEEVADVSPGTTFGGIEAEPVGGEHFTDGVEVLGASPDAGRVVVTSPQNLTAGFEAAGLRSLYEWAGGRLRPVSILPNGESAGQAGLNSSLGIANESNIPGAVSAEGDRVIFEAGHHLYVRDLALAKTVQVDPIQGGTGGFTEQVEFEGANRDASKVFFKDAGRLTSDAISKNGRPDLYECDVSETAGNLTCTVHDLTPGSTPSQAAAVQGKVSAFSENGSIVYFAADGVLTNTPNARGEQAAPADCASETEAATCNLYARNTLTGQTSLVAVLSGEDSPDWNQGAIKGSELTPRSSPDGHYLTFMSQRSLTGYDNHDANSSEPDEEVFLYDDTTGKTTCVSCNPTGARPHGVFDPVDAFPGLLVDRPSAWKKSWLAGSIPGWTLRDILHSSYQSRYLSNSGRMFFNSSDSLVPQDQNGKEDVYEFEPDGVGSCTKASGCVSLISSGSSAEESAFMDASTDGSNVFFITVAKLSTADTDSDFDIYDAHICTSESPCAPQATSVPPPCTTTASCRVASSPQPAIFGPPPSATFNGAGNSAASAPAVKPKAKSLTRAQKLSKALSACKKVKSKSRRAGCQKAARKKYGPVGKARKPGHETKGKK